LKCELPADLDHLPVFREYVRRHAIQPFGVGNFEQPFQ
jgi:hypothetical protein